MPAPSEARLAVLTAEVEHHLRLTYPHLPTLVLPELARQLAWLKWRWEIDQDAAFMAALVPDPQPVAHPPARRARRDRIAYRQPGG
jgi:hypothetical protein